MSKVIVDQSARNKIVTELNTNFLVEAGAGSGKTTSLVDRMVNLIYTGTSQIHEIVAITFTRKAADELKVRFQSVLERKWKNENDEDIRYRLSEGLQNIERCFIGTVHSFCSKLLRERPIEAGLDLNFKELEEADDVDLLEEAWHVYLLLLQEDRPHELKEIDELAITFEELYSSLKEMKNYPDVEWVTEITSKPHILQTYQSFMNIVKEAKRIVPEKEPDKGYDTLQKAILMATQKERFINPSKDKDLISIFELFDKKLKPTYNRWSSKEDAKFYEEKISSYFEVSIKPLIKNWREYCHPIIIHFLQGALRLYTQLKRERSLLNFQDLLISSTSLLKENPEVRKYFQEKYRFLLVDEFQDTDPIQAELMFYLTGEDTSEKVWTKCKPRSGSLFVVGDPKQAIYRFRRADIDTYNRVKELIEVHGGEVLQLTMNFRTLNTVTEQLNMVFKNHLPENESIYQAAYRPLNSYHEDKGVDWSGIKRITVPVDFTKKEVIVQQDAENIAGCIKQLIDEKGYQAKDFMILTRYNEGIATYAESIENAGIPVSISGEVIIGETREFQELSILLNAFIDPTDEVSFVAALRGIFFGISDDELYQWRKSNGQFSIYSSVPATLEKGIKVKFELALEKLRTYQKWIRTFSPTIAIERILEDVGFYPLLVKRGKSKRAFKSLIQIIEALREHEINVNSQYREILNLFSEMVYEKTTVINIEENADAVRVMNVHKAKGLEAPIVFLAHPAKLVNPESNLTKHIKREDDSSRGYFAFTIKNNFQRKELGLPLDWDSLKSEELRYLIEEEMRIIYVAATRAEKVLVISSSAKNDSKNPWSFFFEVEHLDEVELASLDRKKVEKLPSTITFEDYLLQTKDRQQWLEERIEKTYDYWSPTKDKDFSKVSDITREEGGGMNWGTVIHEVFEKIVKGYDLTHYIKASLYKHGITTEKEAEVQEAIGAFKQTRIWSELLLADEVYTEVPFTIKLTRGDSLIEWVEQSADRNESVFVKGVIDLVYRLGDGWVIVDYKTDRPAHAEDYDKLKGFYSSQILFYKHVWERLTNEKVKKEDLYFIYDKHE